MNDSIPVFNQTKQFLKTMKKFLLTIPMLLLGMYVSAADTNSTIKSLVGATASAKISALDVTNYYDQTVTVTGKVVQVTIRPSVTFLNLDKPFPNSPFAIVIFHGKSSFYGDANALKGKTIEIRGKVKKFKDKPEMALDNLDQLTVVGFTNFFAGFTNSARLPGVSAKGLTNAPAAKPSTNGFPEVF